MRHGDKLYPILSVEDALEKILSVFHPLEEERVSVLGALGCVLAADVYATGDIPPHANTAMDGYAVIAADTAGAGPDSPKTLIVIENLAAGYMAERTVTQGTAIRIMTGAPMPAGADAVIPFEETEQTGNQVKLFAEMAVSKNVRFAGEDVKAGTQVLAAGTRLRPQEIGMLAALGHAEVQVIRRPRVAILATGDELVDIDAPLTPGKIRNANGYSNAAQVMKCGGVPLMLGIAQDKVEDLTSRIRSGIAQGADLLLTSGGVSVGDFDVVKQVLMAEGAMTFWRVRMKPGKPLAFGKLTAEVDGKLRTVPVLGMPGNPVSAMVSFELFVRPAILKMRGLKDLDRPLHDAILDDPVARKDDRRHFLRVRIEERAGVLHASLTGGQGSGILNSMVQANGFAIIPEDWSSAPDGAQVQVMLFD
ncbi:MAG: molybdopterin molybdotransferase MoeA [Anaerolineae bacterium]|nr:molybdopterin molybdotransferase MoeA [Anaerolineae bacterium]